MDRIRLEYRRCILKTLIIKSNEDSFERYFSRHVNNNNVDIGTIKKGKFEFFRRVINKLQIFPLYTFWLGNWKKSIKEYDNIVIFDRVLSLTLVKWIIFVNRTCNIKIWLWNIPNFDVNLYKKYATIYCFDKKYAADNNINFLEQFYIPKPLSSINKKDGVVYVGYDKNRYKILKKVAQQLHKNNISYNFTLQKDAQKSYYSANYGIKLVDRPIDYEKVIDISNAYSAILELNISGQTGLTLRTMEALFYGKKLITNNENIRNFPFYNENNFYILGKDKRNIKAFLKEEYQEINSELLSEYTYKKWINDILK